MGLSISSTNAKMGMESTPGRMSIQTTKAQLVYERKRIDLNIHSEPAKVEIDQSACFESAGRKGVRAFAKDAAARGYQQVMEYISKTAQEGNTLAAIENRGNPIADLAVRDAYPEHEFGMVTIPNVRPKITVKEGKLSINPDPINDIGMMNTLRGQYTPGKVDIEYTPSKLRIFMQQYASIHIQYEPEKVDVYI